MGILSSLLSGAAYGPELGTLESGPKPGLDGHFFLAIHLAAFEDFERFTSRVDAIVQQIQSGRRREGIEHLYAPGGLEAALESTYRRVGIPLNDATIEGLRVVARELDLPLEVRFLR